VAVRPLLAFVGFVWEEFKWPSFISVCYFPRDTCATGTPVVGTVSLLLQVTHHRPTSGPLHLPFPRSETLFPALLTISSPSCLKCHLLRRSSRPRMERNPQISRTPCHPHPFHFFKAFACSYIACGLHPSPGWHVTFLVPTAVNAQ
jgi:hypothetical protein